MARKYHPKKDPDLWFNAPKNQAHRLAFPWVNECRTTLRPYYNDVLYYMSLYAGSRDITGCGINVPTAYGDAKLKFGLTSSVVDTAQSIVGSARTLPQTLSRGGDWSTQRRAKTQTKILQSQFQDLGLFNIGTQVIVDGCVTRLGAAHFFVDPETNKPGVERILPLELCFDPVEANAGDVRTIARSKLVNRDVAKILYAEHADAITTSLGPAMRDSVDFTFQRDGQSDQVVIMEAWHLPSKKGAKDGRHIIFTNNCTLFDESWERPRFPLAFYRWAPMQIGFLGKSLVAECEPAQRRVEQIIDYVEKCQNLGSKPQVWLEKGSEVEPDQIDNIPMSVNRYAGPNPPTIFTFDATPHDMENTIDRIRERLLTSLGLSSSQISGEKPAGVSSAVGLRTLEDISSRRHVVNIRQVEQFYLQCAQCLIDTNDEIADNTVDYSIDRRVRTRYLEATSWSETRVKDEDCKTTVYPISSLPPTPAGQLDTLQDWVNTGKIDNEAMMMMLGMPDTEAFQDVESADRTYIEFQAEKMLDGKRMVPDQYCNLSLAADLIRRHYLIAKQDGAPENVLNQLRWFLANAKQTIQKATQAADPVKPGAPAQDPTAGLAPMAQAALPPGAGPMGPGAGPMPMA